MASPGQELSARLQGKRITDRQAGQLIIRQGGEEVLKDEKRIAEAISVMRCESSFDFGASSPNPSGGTNWGGWQIDDRSHPDCPKDCATDPIRATEKVAGWSKNFTDWSIWACKPHPTPADHRAARQAIRDAGGSIDKALEGGATLSDLNPAAAIEQLAQVVEAIAQFFQGLGELILTPEGWVTIAKLVGGAALIAAGTNQLAKQTLGVDPLGTAGRVTTGAAVGAIAGGPVGAALGAAGAGALGPAGRGVARIAEAAPSG